MTNSKTRGGRTRQREELEEELDRQERNERCQMQQNIQKVDDFMLQLGLRRVVHFVETSQ